MKTHTQTNIAGTDYFPTLQDANQFFCPYGYTSAEVNQKIKTKEIFIGKPFVPAGKALIVRDYRYFLIDKNPLKKYLFSFLLGGTRVYGIVKSDSMENALQENKSDILALNPSASSFLIESDQDDESIVKRWEAKVFPKKQIWLNHKACETKEEANQFSNQLIGGGIIQLQNDGKWHVFGAEEFKRKIADGEFSNGNLIVANG